MKSFITASLLVFSSLAQGASSLPPKSVELLKQYDEYEAGKVKALNEDLLRVKKGIVTQLNKHLQDATKNSQLDQAQALIAKIKELEVNIKELEVSVKIPEVKSGFGTKIHKFKLDGKSQERWISTKIKVEKGQTVSIKVEGEISLSDRVKEAVSNGDGMKGKDKHGLDRRFRLGLLIGRISTDDQQIYPLSKSQSFKAEKKGVLEITVNDAKLSNNSGHWDLEIEVK
jgi:hypothetical protein